MVGHFNQSGVSISLYEPLINYYESRTLINLHVVSPDTV